MARRIRRCVTRLEYEQVIKDLVVIGYKVELRGDRNALLRKYKDKNHLLVALLTFWWSMGLCNLIYALIPKRVQDEVEVRYGF